MRALFLPFALAVSACNIADGGPTLAVIEVQPGLASCLVAIDRADVVADSDAAMSAAEIEALVGCTAERAGG